MRKKLLSILLLLCMILTMLPTFAFAEATDYGIMVGTTKVTSDNASNVLGNGTVTYDAGTNTLTLNNASITDPGPGGHAISRYSGDLNIALIGSNTIGVSSVWIGNTGFTGIYTNKKLSIKSTAGGSLSVINTLETQDYNIGISAYEGAAIEGCTVTATAGNSTTESLNNASLGIQVANGSLSIKNATVTANSGITPGLSYGINVDNGSLSIDSSTVIANGGDGTKSSYGIRTASNVTTTISASTVTATGNTSALSFGIAPTVTGLTATASTDKTVTGAAAVAIDSSVYGPGSTYKYVQIASDPDIAIVAAAKTAAQNASYADITQAAAGSEDAIKTALKNAAVTAVNNGDIAITINQVGYTAPIAGTSANPGGTVGSYTFTVTASKGNQSETTDEKTITITATPYTGGTDTQADGGIKSWEDLKTAISNASTSENTTITIGEDVLTSSLEWDPIRIKGGVNITIQSAASGPFKITRADGNKGSFFTFGDGNNSLTLKNIILDGGGDKLSNVPYSPLIYASSGVPGTVPNLILDSGAVLQNNHIKDGSAGAIKFEAGNITMNSGSIIQNNSTDTSGGGIYVLNSTLTMNGGSINNNTVISADINRPYTSFGGGVVLSSNGGDSVFNMNGGSITGNTAYSGGGVHVSGGDSSVFNLSAGEIAGNTATGKIGGGVYLGSASFRGDTELNGALMNIKGNPVIYGNKGGNTSEILESDLHIQGINQVNTKPAVLRKNGELASGAKIGVFHLPSSNATILVSDGTNTVTEADKAYFFSNRATSTIKYDSELKTLFAEESTTAPVITTTSLPDGIAGNDYNQTLVATGTTPITWSVTTGSLPGGLSLNSSTGTISGTPTTAGTFNFTIEAANGTSPAATKAYTVTVTPAAQARWGLAGSDGSAPTAWTEGTLAEAMSYANNRRDKKVYIQLLTDINSSNHSTWPLTFTNSSFTFLDLNGKDIDRGLTVATPNGNVITANAILTIKDSSTDVVSNQGHITGGYNSSDTGGGVFVNNAGIFTLQGGNITGNKTTGLSQGGGGVKAVNNMTNFIMEGGSITGNESYYGHGGAVYAQMAKMTGGSITGNKSPNGAVYTYYSFYLGGTAVIKGNTTDTGLERNVLVRTGYSILILEDKKLSDGALIGVTAESPPTRGIPVKVTYEKTDDYSAYFFSDDSRYMIKNRIDDVHPKDNTVQLLLSEPVIGTLSIPGSFTAGHNLAPSELESYKPTITNNGVTITAQGWQSSVGSGSWTNWPDLGGLTLDTASTYKLRYYATYSGGTVYSNEVTLKVVGNTTALTLTATPDGQQVDGNSVTLTATLTGFFAGLGVDGQTVTFKNGGTTLGTASLNADGVAVFTWTPGTGTYSLTAAYAATPYNTAATSSSVSYKVEATAPVITTISLPGCIVGDAYNQTLVATGTTPIIWSVTEGILPGGLSLDSSTGTISGTPTTAGTFNFTIEATNGTSPVATKALSITINAAPVTVWDGSTAKYFDGGTGTEADPYLIRTAEQLALLADVINSDYTWKEVIKYQNKPKDYLKTAHYKLTADIKLNETTNVANWATYPPSNRWIPIGFNDSRNYYLFSGVFDGDGHTISGMYMDNNSNKYKYLGLFGTTYSFYSDQAVGGVYIPTIKNVTVKDGYLKAYQYGVYASENVGGIVGVNTGVIDNCHNEVNIVSGLFGGGIAGWNRRTVINCSNAGNLTQGEDTYGSFYIGGIVGATSGTNSYVQNCTNSGNIVGTGSVGGIAGEIRDYSTIASCDNTGTVSGTAQIGGIVGKIWTISTVDRCTNTGTVLGTYGNIGGIVGLIWGYTGGNSTLTNSVNTGTVSGRDFIGGIAGGIYNTDDRIMNIIVDGCTNKGTISGRQYIGGVVGGIGGIVNYTTLYNSGKYTVDSCTNTGSVSGTDSIGGIVGGFDNVINDDPFWLGDCINTGMINGDLKVGGIIGLMGGGNIERAFSPIGVTQNANSEIGNAPKYYGYIIGYKKAGMVNNTGIGNITLSPASTTVAKGATETFMVNDLKVGDTIEWYVSGGTSSTTIITNGILTVADDETAATLTVIALVKTNGVVTGGGSTTVTIATPPTLYTVTFDSQGGSEVSSVSGIEEGQSITLPEVPTRNGYRFEGWYTESNGGGTPFTAQTPVNSNLTVYAKWIKLINLSGTVYGTDASTPVSGVVVTLSPVTGTTAKTTGVDGRFDFTDIPEGMYVVTAVYPDGSIASVNVSSDYENVKINKPRPYIEITTQPDDATIVLGIEDSTAVFNVLGQRTPNIAGMVKYKWYWLEGTTPNGGSGSSPDEQISNSEGTPASGSQLTLNSNNTNSLTRGNYSLYAIAYDESGEAYGVYSRIVTLKVIGTNTIEGVVKKEDGTLIEGASVTLEAIGTPIYTPITSNTNPQTTGADGAYKFNTVPDGTYKLIITLPGGDVIESENVVLPETDPNNPSIIDIVVPDKAAININGQPQDVTVKKGTIATLTVNAVATDGTALTYQWYKNSKNANIGGTELSGATEKDYTPLSTEKGTFYYYCVVTGGSLEAITSRAAKLTVIDYGIISGTVKTKEGNLIANAVVELVNTDTPLQTGFTTSANPQTTLADGKYRFIEVLDGNYKLKITLPDGTTFEKPIVVPGINEEVIITQPEQPIITITGQPRSMTVVLGDTAEFSVTASVSSGDTVLYQWYQNTEESTIGGTAILGATNATYTVDTTDKSVSYYYCVVNAAGAKAVTSSLAKLTVRNTPLDNLMTIQGDVLDDASPGNPVQGATVALSPKAGTSANPQTTGENGHYKFENLPEGKYTVTVTLPNGGTVKKEIIIDDGDITPTQPSNIEVPAANNITIMKQPADIQLTTDMTAVFDTKATASKAGVTYQWYSSTTNTNSGGIKLEGKTDAMLQLDKQAEGISYYYCVISSIDTVDVATRAAKLTVTKAADNKGDVGGSILGDENGQPVEGASVKLMKNGTDGYQFGSAVITGADGKFQFSDIPYGSYSLVAQKETQIITRQINIRSKLTTENLTMLSGGKLTRVEVAQGAPSAAVENLEEMFTSDDEVIAQQLGAKIEIKLVVEQKDNPEDREQIIALLNDDEQVGLYLDAKLVKTISGTVSDDSTENIQPIAGKVLRIVLDLPESLQGRSGYKIIRSHTENGVTSTRIIDNPVYDEILQTLTFEADAFSTYAVAYTQTYSVTVLGSQDTATSGAGLYKEGDTVAIRAGARSGYTFTGWTSTDGITFATVGSATTTFTMPAKDVTVSANWKENEVGSGSGNGTSSENKKSYSVTVNGSQPGDSSGAGLYKEGDTVAIHAGARSGYTFTGWTSTDGISFATVGSATTTFTMPAKDVTVSANWKENGTSSENKKSYSVTVNGSQSGDSSGAGLYKEGDTVAIRAGARSGYIFTGWTSTERVSFADAGSENTTFTMVAEDVTVTANWEASKGESGKTGNGNSADSESGIGTDSGNKNSSDTVDGSDKASGKESSSGSKSANSTGGNNSTSNVSNSNTGESDNNAEGDQIILDDLNKAKNDAINNLKDQLEKAINSLPDTLKSKELQVASDKIKRIYKTSLDKIQNAETPEVVSKIYHTAISDINTVIKDQGANTIGENTKENKDTGKPFILFNALLTLAAILAAGLLLIRRGKELLVILAAASAAAELVVFMLTSGFAGFALANTWTIACAAFATYPIWSLVQVMREKKD